MILAIGRYGGRAVLTIALTALPAYRLSAQCPDGSPPPCRGAAMRLDERTWLVLPFKNTARDTTADLVRNASVPLLYQEMSRWQDVRVISDERVADLLFDSIEQRAINGLNNAIARSEFRATSTLIAFHLRRTGPGLDTAARHPVKRLQAWLARGERVRAAAALEEFDRELTARHPATSDDGGFLFSAESHLELGDSAVALARLREFARRWYFYPAQPSIILDLLGTQQARAERLWPRTWLLYGDVAMATGNSREARRAYRMVEGLWDRGDPILQPTVTRVRVALAQLN